MMFWDGKMECTMDITTGLFSVPSIAHSQYSTCDDKSHPWKQVIANITESSLNWILASYRDMRTTVDCPERTASFSCVELCSINIVLPPISSADLCVSLKRCSAAHEASGFVSIFASLLSSFLISGTLRRWTHWLGGTLRSLLKSCSSSAFLPDAE